jgi:hypothetical protein
MPDFLLKFRALKIEREIECLARAREILFQLPLGFEQHGPLVVLDQFREAHPVRLVVFPQNGGKALAIGDELQLADGRIHQLVCVRHFACS